MTERTSACQARRQGDEMHCGRCGLQWDVRDTDPPKCRNGEREAGARAIERLRERLKR